MILKSLHLKNIRSYVDERITFPEGSILLSGDMGSGKSSILLSVEFALFGIKRGEFSGNSLLRNGEKEGFVELNFSIDRKDVIIKRILKRGKEAIKQEAGYIIINNEKKDMTPVELKAKIYELLGYPINLLSKSKDAIFRFTVYTPQEEMKQILFETPDIRLDTLRRVFDIDKYKNIRENCVIYTREIKSKKAGLLGLADGLDDRRKELEENKKKIIQILEKLEPLQIKLEKTRTIISEHKIVFEKKEKEAKELLDKKRELTILENQLKDKVIQVGKNNDRIRVLKESISEDIEEKKSWLKKNEDIIDRKKELSELLIGHTKEKEKIHNDIQRSVINIQNAEQTKNKVSKIDKCPTCLQKMDEGHKTRICSNSDKIIEENKVKEKNSKENLSLVLEKINSIEKEIEEIRSKEKKIIQIKSEINIFEEKRKTISVLEEENKNIKAEVGEINKKKAVLSESIENVTEIEEELLELKKKYEELRDGERRIELEKVSLEKEKEGMEKLSFILLEEIKKKEEAKKKILKLNSYKNWLEEYFVNLVIAMEKYVMAKIYREFNELFQRWLDMLIEDETITARLDEEFTPIINQNGYDVDFVNLSGGEKQSVALAYRLALNKVLNTLIETIRTKDLIILDEPTEGFSSEQIDKIKEVLEELMIKQIIIVSHETKIESYVDKTIRINKEEHISSVIG